ncbi:unnamed protein product [Phyllotreta striolata]|uniref:U5 small nuclear ribonucleoprotein TSSC4 n=1 Tax=Phyllotreta striolata TaxID=444603 RepID=A0A9N9TU42_PHYSR|nr:unnamed protein product [Phyllotreta striolata]
MSVNDKFVLKSTNADFNLRQKNVFDQLNALESGRNQTSPSNDVEMDTDEPDGHEAHTPRQQRSITKRLRGKESIFKKPQNPVPKNYINRIPDFKKNPHKWTRYSLDDVEEVSDRSNTKAALSFLEELNHRKLTEPAEDEEATDLTKKIVFKKQTRPIETVSRISKEEPEKLTGGFKSSKVLMPEYVVGQKVKKDKKKKTIMLGKELKLDHLYEDE